MEQENAERVVRLFVGGLGFGVSCSDLQERFTPLGRVLGVELPDAKAGQSHRGFGYVDFEPASEASLCKLFSSYNGCAWRGGRLRVETSKEHYLKRLHKEWDAAAELMEIGVTTPLPPTGQTKKSSNASLQTDERMEEFRLFIPKLKKVKTVPAKGLGKHKRSFQRVESAPVNHLMNCSCDEHLKDRTFENCTLASDSTMNELKVVSRLDSTIDVAGERKKQLELLSKLFPTDSLLSTLEAEQVLKAQSIARSRSKVKVENMKVNIADEMQGKNTGNGEGSDDPVNVCMTKDEVAAEDDENLQTHFSESKNEKQGHRAVSKEQSSTIISSPWDKLFKAAAGEDDIFDDEDDSFLFDDARSTHMIDSKEAAIEKDITTELVEKKKKKKFHTKTVRFLCEGPDTSHLTENERAPSVKTQLSEGKEPENGSSETFGFLSVDNESIHITEEKSSAIENAYLQTEFHVAKKKKKDSGMAPLNGQVVTSSSSSWNKLFKAAAGKDDHFGQEDGFMAEGPGVVDENGNMQTQASEEESMMRSPAVSAPMEQAFTRSSSPPKEQLFEGATSQIDTLMHDQGSFPIMEEAGLVLNRIVELDALPSTSLDEPPKWVQKGSWKSLVGATGLVTFSLHDITGSIASPSTSPSIPIMENDKNDTVKEKMIVAAYTSFKPNGGSDFSERTSVNTASGKVQNRFDVAKRKGDVTSDITETANNGSPMETVNWKGGVPKVELHKTNTVIGKGHLSPFVKSKNAEEEWLANKSELRSDFRAKHKYALRHMKKLWAKR